METQTGVKKMTKAQIKEATDQSERIVAMMDAETRAWFFGLGADDKFYVMCAFLAATA